MNLHAVRMKSYEVHMKPYTHNFTWNHVLITSHEIRLNYIRIYYDLRMYFIWSLYELLMNFTWNEIKFIHINLIRSSYEIHRESKWTSHEFDMKSNQIYHMNLHAVRMKFIWTSYRRTNEVDILYPCNTNEVDMRLINSSHEMHMKFIWISNDLYFMWTS